MLTIPLLALALSLGNTIANVAVAAIPQSPPAATSKVVGCADDAHEPNDERRRARRIDGVVHAATHRDDIDWYRIELPADAPLELHITVDGDGPRPEIAIFAPRGRKSRGQIADEAEARVLRFVVERAGIHRVRVRGRSDACVGYTLSHAFERE